jgi:hypothetical protein
MRSAAPRAIHTILAGRVGFCNAVAAGGRENLRMSNQKCPVCRERKPKRACPALGETICTVCCATKREVEIKCPPGCVYLSSARSHPPAVVQRRQDRDLGFLVPLVANLTETQHRLVLVFQSAALKHADRAMPPLEDGDVAEAAAAVAATLETARKGIIYEHQAVSGPAQRLTAEFRRVVSELLEQNPSYQARIEREAAAALRVIEEGACTAQRTLAGDEPPVYLKLLARILGTAANAREGGDVEPASQGRLIIQP